MLVLKSPNATSFCRAARAREQRTAQAVGQQMDLPADRFGHLQKVMKVLVGADAYDTIDRTADRVGRLVEEQLRFAGGRRLSSGVPVEITA